MGHTDFLILGGGVIGMMTALQLAEAGHDITLIERGQCGREASWAGGGIISPLYPWRYADPVNDLARWSARHYPQLARRLAADTGIDPEYRRKGLLYLEVKDEARAGQWAHDRGTVVQRVGGDFIHALEPHLAAGLRDGLWMPEWGSIRNPRLCQALRARLLSLPGVRLREGEALQELLREGRRIIGVRTRNGPIHASAVVLCAGAWTGRLLENLGLHLPVHPVKGQMMLFNTAPLDGRALLDRVVLHDDRYLIPRADGRLLIGSTLENAGFDKTPTDEARRSLYQSAVALLPALSECPVEHHWAGLRPGVKGDLPFIGAVPERDGLFVNAGHFRNGLVLAPAATRLLVDQLLGRTPIIAPEPFQPAGFCNASIDAGAAT